MIQVRHFTIASLLAGTLLATSAMAAVADLHISSEDTIAFSDDFANNAAGWTASGTDDLGTFGGTQLSQTVWQPTSAGANIFSKITATLPTTLDIKNGPISIYYRVAVQRPSGSTDNRFQVQLMGGTANNGFFGFQLAPGNLASTTYVGRSGLGASGTANSQAVTTAYTPAANTFINYRLTMTFNGTGFTLSEYLYNEVSGQYVLFGTGTNDSTSATTGILGTGTNLGVFSTLQLSQRNFTGATNADYFDAVAITQSAVPEPAALGMLGLGMGLALLRQRR